MSGSEQYERVSVSSDGVTVDKRFEEDEFPVPAIAFEIQSERSETVTVTIVDEVPEDVAVEDLGFHPEYGSEFWTIDEERITFEREMEASGEYTTVYGIRATGTEDVEKFLTEPVIESVDPPLEEADDVVVDEGSTDVVRDVISGDSDSVPGLDEGDSEGEDEDVETLDLKDPNDPTDDGPADGATGGDTSGEDGEGDGGTASVESLVGALAAELRNGSVDEDDVKLLRKAFDLVDDSSGGSVDARIQRLQTEVADLLAYTDALEEFLDENGTAEQTIEGFRTEVESLQSELQEVGEMARGHEEALADVQTTVSGVESTVDSLESELDGVLEEVESVRSEVDDVEESVESVENTVGDVSSSVDEVEQTVDDVSSSVNEVEQTVDDVEKSVDDVEGSVNSVESDVEAVESDLDSLESQVGDIDVEGIQNEVEDIESEIEDLKEWREQLSSVIGGGS
jgi:predicted  nucleic acid-binding Zn-ribbon protein